MGWVCTNCGAKYGDPPYDIHSSWGCAKCCPSFYGKESSSKYSLRSTNGGHPDELKPSDADPGSGLGLGEASGSSTIKNKSNR